jgi:hypothetical protein
MFLKWTAKALAAGAALQLGIAAAQDDALLIPPGPAGEDQAGDAGADPGKVPEASQDVDDARQEARDEAREGALDAVERESRFAPSTLPAGDGPQVDDRIRAATQSLDIDDETRSRYRWHNGEWWFKTRSGQWKFYRDGAWQEFDPTTYQPLTPGGASYSPQAGGTYFVPQTYGASSGYSYGPQPYTYRSDLDRYDGRYYGGSRFYDGRYDGRYYNPRLDNPAYGTFGSGYQGPYGAGYRGYDPGTDRYYGRGAFGQPYSIDGDRYRGGVIGSEIGGRLGGRTGAIIGGAIGADAAD